MKIHRHLRASWKALLAGLVMLALVASCNPPPPSAPGASLPAEFLGRWTLAGTSGGIDGREIPADGSWIVITADNTLERYSADGRLAATEAFTPARGRSIFSGSDAWILGGGVAAERVIAVHPEGVLTISDNVYDGFGSHYTRAP
jgi:hypothetical protein